MKHVIFTKTDFKGSFIKPRSSIRCVRKSDDVMSDDVIVDYIIAKNGEMTCDINMYLCMAECVSVCSLDVCVCTLLWHLEANQCPADCRC